MAGNWRPCDQCEGACCITEATSCLAHAGTEKQASAFKQFSESGEIDVRGVAISAALIQKILDAAPQNAAGHPTFSTAQFSRATFEHGAKFSGAIFEGHAGFGGATFKGDAGFGGSAFKGDAGFGGVTFEDNAWFGEATFKGDAGFGGTTFKGDAGFGGATFEDNAWFGEATFKGDAGFGGTTFKDNAWFDKATFKGGTRFDKATFKGHAGFDEATFNSGAAFGGAIFKGHAGFDEATFKGGAWFDKAIFKDSAAFDKAIFKGGAGFGGAIFEDSAGFDKATFKGHAGFGGATFKGSAAFGGATFEDSAGFGEAIFKGDTWFREAIFKGRTWFSGATFKRFVLFTGAEFGGDVPMLGFITVAGLLDLDEVQFTSQVRILVDAGVLSCRRGRFLGGVQFNVQRAVVRLDDSDLSVPSLFTGHPISSPAEAAQQPRLLSLQRANVAGLALGNVSLADCRFAGSHNLDKLRVEAEAVFGLSPAAAGWERRQIIAEEQAWRAARTRSGRWAPPSWPDPEPPPKPLSQGAIAGLYRALRKGREDAKDEPGAADFYYGEMEMRRHDRPTGRAGKWRGRASRIVLTAYWLVSGYAQRAWRSLAALAAVTALFAVAFHYVGFAEPPKPASYWTSLLYAFRSTISLTDSQVTLTAWGSLFQALLRITGPVLLGLMLLALRR